MSDENNGLIYEEECEYLMPLKSDSVRLITYVNTNSPF